MNCNANANFSVPNKPSSCVCVEYVTFGFGYIMKSLSYLDKEIKSVGVCIASPRT